MEQVLGFSYLGIPKTSQKIVPGNTVTSLAASVLSYQQHVITFTSGGTTAIAVGDTVVGATSGYMADVLAVTLTGGSWAGGDAAGTLTVKNLSAPLASWTNNENLKVGAGTDEATMTGKPVADTSDYEFKGATAKAALIQATGNAALMCIDGSSPNQTRLKGLTLAANTAFVLIGPEVLRNLKVIDLVAGSASAVNVTLFYSGPWGGPG